MRARMQNKLRKSRSERGQNDKKEKVTLIPSINIKKGRFQSHIDVGKQQVKKLSRKDRGRSRSMKLLAMCGKDGKFT